MLERVVVTVGVGQKAASPIVIVPAFTPLTEEVELPPPQLFVALTRSVSVPVDVGVPEIGIMRVVPLTSGVPLVKPFPTPLTLTLVAFKTTILPKYATPTVAFGIDILVMEGVGHTG